MLIAISSNTIVLCFGFPKKNPSLWLQISLWFNLLLLHAWTAQGSTYKSILVQYFVFIKDESVASQHVFESNPLLAALAPDRI